MTIFRKLLGISVAALTLPIALVVALVAMPFNRPIRRTPDDVVLYLRNFIEGTGDKWDWDDFVSIKIDDPRLEDIRARACAFPDIDDETLLGLLREAESLASTFR